MPKKTKALSKPYATYKNGKYSKEWKEVSLKKDKKGFYVYTHRCRSNSYPTINKIPVNVLKFVGSTG